MQHSLLFMFKGRTGLVIACFLVYAQGLTAQQAIEQVRKHRLKICANFFLNQLRPKSIQTRRQIKFVVLFGEYVQKLRQVFPSVSVEDALKRFDSVISPLIATGSINIYTAQKHLG